LKDFRPFRGIVDQHAGRHGGEGNEYRIRCNAVYPSRHAFMGLDMQSHPFPVGQGIPFQSGRARRFGRQQRGQQNKNARRNGKTRTQKSKSGPQSRATRRVGAAVSRAPIPVPCGPVACTSCNCALRMFCHVPFSAASPDKNHSMFRFFSFSISVVRLMPSISAA
jgi:hypothetical protein